MNPDNQNTSPQDQQPSQLQQIYHQQNVDPNTRSNSLPSSSADITTTSEPQFASTTTDYQTINQNTSRVEQPYLPQFHNLHANQPQFFSGNPYLHQRAESTGLESLVQQPQLLSYNIPLSSHSQVQIGSTNTQPQLSYHLPFAQTEPTPHHQAGPSSNTNTNSNLGLGLGLGLGLNFGSGADSGSGSGLGSKPVHERSLPQYPGHSLHHSTSYIPTRYTTLQSLPESGAFGLAERGDDYGNPVNVRAHDDDEDIQDKTPTKKHRRSGTLINSSGFSVGTPSNTSEFDLKQLALAKLNTPLEELAYRIKVLENDSSLFNINTSLGALNSGSGEAIGSLSVISSSVPASSDPNNNKETQRLLFGMIWLLNSCEISPTAVIPRNRIYARYVQVCADYGLSPLSPASFGKLVKILYPNITTRRLGMRGQSKYHYCGIKLKGDQNMQLQMLQLQRQAQSKNKSKIEIENESQPFVDTQAQQHQTAYTTVTHSPYSSANSSASYEDPSNLTLLHVQTPSYTPINSPKIKVSASFTDQLPLVGHMKYIPDLFKLLGDLLVAPESYPYSPIILPSIYPFLPADADRDLADTLHSLYKVHVNTVFEALRYMHLKKLFASFNTFNSILTAPVFKLYTNESVLEWVKSCDLLMYKKMIRMLSKLHLQFQIPLETIDQLKQVSQTFLKNLSNSIITNNKIPRSFIFMKLKFAKYFVNLLNRIIKNLETGQPASRILNDENEISTMLHDWNKLDFAEIISREMPCQETTSNTLIRIMSTEVSDLLKVNIAHRPFSSVSVSASSSASSSSSLSLSGIPTETARVAVIMRNVADFVASLPGRFPEVNERLFLLLTSNFLTTCLREISLSSGEGFGAWWIVRCWIDEYLALILELGGFYQEEFKSHRQYSLSHSHHSQLHQQRYRPSSLFSLQSKNVTRPGNQLSFGQAVPAYGSSSISHDISFGAIDLLETSFDFDEKIPTSLNREDPSLQVIEEEKEKEEEEEGMGFKQSNLKIRQENPGPIYREKY